MAKLTVLSYTHPLPINVINMGILADGRLYLAKLTNF